MITAHRPLVNPLLGDEYPVAVLLADNLVAINVGIGAATAAGHILVGGGVAPLAAVDEHLEVILRRHRPQGAAAAELRLIPGVVPLPVSHVILRSLDLVAEVVVLFVTCGLVVDVIFEGIRIA